MVLKPAVLGASELDETIADSSGLKLETVFQCVLTLF